MAADYISKIEEYLGSCLPKGELREQKLIDAMRYSLRAGGKRVRPRLALEFCALCGGNPEAALPFACAVELIHTYSLIHDDLPCMDDDDMRRGQPSNHKVFGESTALLAGDALLTLAFEVMTSDEAAAASSERACRLAVHILASRAGAVGMVGGQVIDLENENKSAPIEILREMDEKKTARLIQAACELGCIAAGADEEKIRAASLYGECLGIAFQIQDDILDCTASVQELGKPVGSDVDNNKSTYVSLLGIDKCRELVDELTARAIEALNVFDADSSELSDYARELANRRN